MLCEVGSIEGEGSKLIGEDVIIPCGGRETSVVVDRRRCDVLLSYVCHLVLDWNGGKNESEQTLVFVSQQTLQFVETESTSSCMYVCVRWSQG